MKIKILLLSLSAHVFFSLTLQGQNAVQEPVAKNVILLIGDGMGVAQVYAAMSVSKDKLNIERSQFFGYSKTYSASDYTTDSGAGATAISTGKKTYNKAIAVDTNKQALIRITDLVKANGQAYGVVATCEVVHATPASFMVSDTSRYNSVELAKSIVYSEVDILIGGGAQLFDTLGLIDSMKLRGYDIEPDLTKIDIRSDKPVVSLPYKAHPPKMINGRGDYLPQATKIAMEKLSNNQSGFFLMVEGSQMDWGGHANDINYIVSELIDFDNAVGAAYDFADRNPGTLVVVTADHETGGLSLLSGSVENKTVEAAFATTGHTGVMVPVFAYGAGAKEFSAIMENTDIFFKIAKLMGIGDDILKESIVVEN